MVKYVMDVREVDPRGPWHRFEYPTLDEALAACERALAAGFETTAARPVKTRELVSA